MPEQTFLTPQGTCLWAKIFKPDFKYDEFSIDLILSANEAAPLVSQIRDFVSNDHAQRVAKAESIKGYSKPPFEQMEDGQFKFTFKQRAEGGPKDGPKFSLKPDVMDAKLNPWPADTLLGNDSVIRVCYHLWGWNVAVQGGVGVTLRLKAVQVIKHVEYIAPPRTHGFSQEDGIDTNQHGFSATGQTPQPGNSPEDIPLGNSAAAPATQPSGPGW